MRDRPETMAGRWAAKEAVSKVLGLGVRGIGWRDIEIERLPTGQPSVRLHGRAAARADQLGDGADRGLDQPRGGLRGRDRVRDPDGRRPVRLPARHRGAARRARAADPRPDRAPASDGRGRRRRPALASDAPDAAAAGSGPVPERGPVGFGRRDGTARGRRPDRDRARSRPGRSSSTTTSSRRSSPSARHAATRARSASCW